MTLLHLQLTSTKECGWVMYDKHKRCIDCEDHAVYLYQVYFPQVITKEEWSL